MEKSKEERMEKQERKELKKEEKICVKNRKGGIWEKIEENVRFGEK